MKQLIPYGGILFCINLVAVTNVLAVVEKDPPKEERTAELTCNINIMPDTVACGQGVGHITLHADIKCITASGTACEDVGLVWRPEVSGVNGGLPELEQQGATTTGLIFSTQLNGESIESFNVKLVVTSAANNLKEICNTPVTVGECSHDCNGELGGNAVEDSCGICGGDGSTCSDCAGVPYGEATYDACGVCNGDGSSCADCNGVPNGEALYDACGVCDGDGSSCLDCPQGIDECGICGGDNTSCLLCESRDISPSQFELDGAAQNLNTLIIKGVNVLRRTRGRSTAFQNLMNTAHEAYLKSWTTIWSFESTQLSNCSSDTLCSSSDNTEKKQAYVNSVETLYTLHKRLRRKLKRNERTKKAKQIWNSARNQYSTATEQLNTIPSTQQHCEK